MLSTILKLSVVALTIVTALESPCPGKQAALQSSAEEWPTPTGDVSSYISSFSSANNGVFSNCEDFTSGMPSSLSSPYQAWVTSVSDWSTNFESTRAAAASTCLALVAVVVIPIPQCPDDGAAVAVATGDSGSSATEQSASSSATGDAAQSTDGSSGAASISAAWSFSLSAMMACAGAIGALAVAL